MNPTCETVRSNLTMKIRCTQEENGKQKTTFSKELVTYGLAISKNNGNLVGITDTGEVDVCVPDGSKIRCDRVYLGMKCFEPGETGGALVIDGIDRVPVAPSKMANEANKIIKSGKKCEW